MDEERTVTRRVRLELPASVEHAISIAALQKDMNLDQFVTRSMINRMESVEKNVPEAPVEPRKRLKKDSDYDHPRSNLWTICWALRRGSWRE